ncbi:MAG TPA: EAL domain-containing protein [Burkholderiales bacterium]|nr:EAL domain-containing protein [Burkholderiales bacterium]
MEGAKLVAEPRAAAFELAGAGLVVTDTAGLILRANQVYAQLLGTSIKELVGTAFTDAFPTHARALAQRALKGALVPDALPMPSQWSLERRSGGSVAVLLTIRPTEMPSGRLGAVLTVIDISALNTTEARLFAALEEQRLILDNAQVGILFTRAQRVMRYNLAFATLFDCGDSTLVGQSWALLFGASENVPSLPSERTYHAEHRLRRPDGSEIWCMVDGRAFGAPAEEQIIWTFREITTERTAHAALETARASLELRVAARTRDLEEKNVELQTQITERREIEERLRGHNEKLVFHRNQLLALAERDAPDFSTALHDIASVALRTLGLDRISFWRLHAERDVLECELSLRADHQADPLNTPRQLNAAAQMGRFASIAGHQIIDASTARGNAALEPVMRDYMQPLGILSMLDLPVWLEGRVIGKIGFEVRQEERRWAPEDIDFAAGICTLLALAQEADQRRDAEAKLRRLAHFDALTGLPNRHLLLDRLKQALAYAQRHRSGVALMFIDLDRFKTINDSLGHIVGDQLLVEVSRRLIGSLRAEDSVARIGGDEFVVILQDVRNVAQVTTVAQNLLQAIEPAYVIDNRSLHVSGSIGIALYPEDGTDIDSLMRNADTAMYYVKDSGRNGFKFFTSSMNAEANERLSLENDLRLALRRNELVLYYQPQYEIASGRVRAIEALLRWQHPVHGLILPGAFVPIAEESGLIQSIGEWTLTQACAQIEQWLESGLPPIPVAVNLSARQFRNPNFAHTIELVLAASHLSPSMLELEITESALVHDTEANLDTLHMLKSIGLRLALDDFGIGYSSLAYLKRFPIDKIKIDQSFIRDIPGDADDVAITRAMISMSKDLALRVVAEGVETEEQLAFLRQRGCDEAQGYLLCPPLPPDELYARLAGVPRALMRQNSED